MVGEKATPRVKTRQTKAPTLPPISSTRAPLLQQPVKAQAVDRQRKEQKVTIRKRMTAVEGRLVRLIVEGTEADHSQRFISMSRLKSIPTVMR